MIRLSTIPYLNALPLVHHLSGIRPQVQIVQARPSSALRLLDNADVDMALVPVVDCLDRSDLYRVPGLGICANGPVTSVLLQSEKPIGEVLTVRTDPSSRTSNCLAGVLCRFHWQASPMFLEECDAADGHVVIGDAALTSCPSNYTYDLSEHWNILTSLPFVFAVWVCRRGRSDISELVELVHLAYDRSKQTMPMLVAEGAKRLGLSLNMCEHYLTSCLHYRVGHREERALTRFEHYISELSQGGRDSLSPEAGCDRRHTLC